MHSQLPVSYKELSFLYDTCVMTFKTSALLVSQKSDLIWQIFLNQLRIYSYDYYTVILSSKAIKSVAFNMHLCSLFLDFCPKQLFILEILTLNKMYLKHFLKYW